MARPHWFDQPPGLAILFLTQMWEIFSYYGMRTLLVYYMTKQLLFGQQHASLVYGVYVATFYFTPIFGGVISDRWLGRKRAVIIGAAIMSVGHFLMASESLLYFALAAMVHRFYYLKYALATVLVFIGAKIFVSDFILGGDKFPPALSLGVTFALIAAGIFYSLWKTRTRREPDWP